MSNYIIILILVLLLLIGIILALVFGLKKKDNPSSSPSLPPANFVAVGTSVQDGNNIKTMAYSYDGSNWLETKGVAFVNANDTEGGCGVAYGICYKGSRPLWVASGRNDSAVSDQNNLLYSYDGIFWQVSTGENFSVNGSAVAYGLSADKSASMWVAVGSDGNDRNDILYSSDGIEWQLAKTPGFYERGNGIAYGISGNGVDPMWVSTYITSDAGPGLVYSYNGIDWSATTGANFDSSINEQRGINVAFGVSKYGTSPMWVAIGSLYINNFGYDNRNILFSLDGVSWQVSRGASLGSVDTNQTFPKARGGVAYGLSVDGVNPVWVATGVENQLGGDNYNRNILYSLDGMEWFYSDPLGASFKQIGSDVIYNSATKQWIATGQSDNNSMVLVSNNGITWENNNSNIPFSKVMGFGASAAFNPALVNHFQV